MEVAWLERDKPSTYALPADPVKDDVVTIQTATGLSALTTTSRYVHPRPASERAQAFTAAFAAGAAKDVAVAV